MEGQLFNQKRLKSQQPGFEDSESTISIASYSSKKLDAKK